MLIRKEFAMPFSDKYNRIVDALQELLTKKNIRNISVSEIAQTAGVGKGSIYYYFASKEEIFNALIARSYEEPLQTAKKLVQQVEIDPFTRMAMLFQACHNVSGLFTKESNTNGSSANQQEHALHRQKYFQYIISEFKPVLTDIIMQAQEQGKISFEFPSALAEISLLILVVKIDNTLLPSTPEEIEETLRGFVLLLERGAKVEEGALKYIEEAYES